MYLVGVQKKYKIKKPIILKWHFLRYGIDIEVTPDEDNIRFIQNQLVSRVRKIKSLSKERDNFFPNETPLCNWCHYWEECTAKTISNPAKRLINANS